MKYPIRTSIILGLLFFCTLATHGCGTREDAPQVTDRKNRADLTDLYDWMTGSFSSQEQSVRDSAFYDIRLEMVPIWKERSDARWLYVEQAVATSVDEPYRQRVYRVSQIDDTTYRSDVYTIPDPMRFAGAWKEDQPLNELTPDSLELREGCSIIMVAEGDSAFVGGSVGEGCASDLRGAVYAVSEVRITGDGMVTWDRGFDAEANQVWGAETGGYEFRRVVRVEKTDDHSPQAE